MKFFKFLILILICFSFVAGHAVTVSVDSPGTLSSLISTADKKTITDLTVTGNVDARDFKCLRDELTVLSRLDISAVNIQAYSGTGGTSSSTNYLVNRLPDNSFMNKTVLKIIVLPASLTYMGAYSLCGTGVTTVNIPPLVTYITYNVFENTYSLTEITVDAANPSYTSQDGILFNKIKTTLLQCPTLKKGDYIIPASVVTINNVAFKLTNLSTITMPNSVTTIGVFAFSDTKTLTSINFSTSLTSIGDNAFLDCVNLSGGVVLPNTLTKIGNSVFSNCNDITSVSIPNSVTTIGNFAFSECQSLTSVYLPSSLTSIGNYAFTNCRNAKGDLIIPNTLKTIGEGAFSYCVGFSNLVIGNSVTSIGNGAFRNCINLGGALVLPNSLTQIGSFTFYNCNQLTNLSIPNSITSIGNFAFEKCSSLNGSLNIPNSVTSIGESAFAFCSNLKKLVIPASVISIAKNAFWSCKGLNLIQCFLSIPIDLSNINGVFMDVNKSVCTLQVPHDSRDIYRAAYGWKDFIEIEDLQSN